jgi:hypothetical protein
MQLSRRDPVQALDEFGIGVAEGFGMMNHHRVSALGFGRGDHPEESGEFDLVAGLGMVRSWSVRMRCMMTEAGPVSMPRQRVSCDSLPAK